MKDNAQEIPASAVIPSPVVIFDHVDAVWAANKVKASMPKGWQTVFAVCAVTDVKMLAQHVGQLIVTRYVKSNKTAKEQVKGSWAVTVPIEGTELPHVFRVSLPPEERGESELIVPERGPVTAHA